MSAQHTPGPWSIFDHSDDARINVRGPNEEFIADCADGFWSDEADGWVMADESLPNARLIAAAPELLEALREAIETSDRLCAERGWVRAAEAEETLAKMRAAILKAREGKDA